MINKQLEELFNESQRLSQFNSEEASQYFITNGYGAEKESFQNMLITAEKHDHCLIMYFHDQDAMQGYIKTLKQQKTEGQISICKAPKINFHSEKILFGCNTTVYTYSKPDGTPRRLNGIFSNSNTDMSALLHGVTLYSFFKNIEDIKNMVEINDKIFNGGQSILQEIKFTETDDETNSERNRKMLSIIRDNNLLVLG